MINVCLDSHCLIAWLLHLWDTGEYTEQTSGKHHWRVSNNLITLALDEEWTF